MKRLLSAIGLIDDNTEISHAVKRKKRACFISLDVGGTIFRASWDTLIASPYFRNVYSGHFEVSDEPYFIDRDAEYFRHVLNFLRTRKAVGIPGTIREAVILEAEYFQVNELVDILRDGTSFQEGDGFSDLYDNRMCSKHLTSTSIATHRDLEMGHVQNLEPNTAAKDDDIFPHECGQYQIQSKDPFVSWTVQLEADPQVTYSFIAGLYAKQVSAQEGWPGSGDYDCCSVGYNLDNHVEAENWHFPVCWNEKYHIYIDSNGSGREEDLDGDYHCNHKCKIDILIV